MLFTQLLRTLLVIGLAVGTGFIVTTRLPGDRGATAALVDGRLPASLSRRPVADSQPVAVQMAAYVAALARGDLGMSRVQSRPVAALLKEAVPATMFLGGVAMLLAVGLGVGLGTLAGWAPTGPIARYVGPLLLLLYTLPDFILGTAAMGLFASWWGILPVGGMIDVRTALSGTPAVQFLDRVQHVILPATVLAIGWSAALFRQQQQAVAALRDSRMVQVATAKGLSPLAVLRRHILPRATAGTVALASAWLPTLAGGAVVVESIFAWPGMGRLFVQAVALRDAPVVAGGIVVVATVVAVGALLTDLRLRRMDPRVEARA